MAEELAEVERGPTKGAGVLVVELSTALNWGLCCAMCTAATLPMAGC